MTSERLPQLVREALERLPVEPGVYQMLDAAGAVLYVGKAVELRSRVRSYFQPGRVKHARTDAMVEQVADIRTIIVANETEALLLESNLIKQHRPPFNVRLKDDKSYPFLKLTLGETFPRVIFTRKLVDDGGRYFGPYTDAAALRELIEIIRRAFPLRTCTGEIGVTYRRPCLQYHIKRCMAPCAFLQTKEEYDALVADVTLFLEGRYEVLVGRLEREMEHVGVADVLKTSLAAELQRLLGDVDALGAAQKRQLLEHQTCAAARIEHLEVVPSGVSMTDPVQHDAAPRCVPPVCFFGAVEDLVGVKVQLAVFKQGSGPRYRHANLDGAVREVC